ncbi:galanin receptor type 1-like [Xenia sp. Carnegie-2017]|uniref:galanin receptor type 1-like n=1 Tax=Xenia sp. Carnegie-2017 TaxID=2897299 RepID=UPI001F042D27|nr:galanin receptor type 1-like [Xenia sp. Carnegie-2017]
MTGFDLRAWELVCYTFIFIFGVVGNFIVILVIRKSRRLPKHRFRHVPFNVYLMNLAIVDLALCAICLPVYIMGTSSFPHPTGVNGDVLCKLVTGNLPQFWLAGVSIYILVIISFERHYSITRPFQSRMRVATWKTYVYIGIAWFFGFLREIPVLVGIRYTAINATIGTSCYYWPSKTTNIFVFSILFLTQYVFPSIVFLVNFSRTTKHIRRLDKTLKLGIQDERERIKTVKGKKRSIRIVLIVLLVFLLFWTPNNIMYFLLQIGKNSDVVWSSDVYQMGIILGFSSSSMNPIIYAFQSKEFRKNCANVFRQFIHFDKDRRKQTDKRRMNFKVIEKKANKRRFQEFVTSFETEINSDVDFEVGPRRENVVI